MAFVKELVSEDDKELYNSFEIYDYEHNEIHHWRSQKKWVIDRENKIYFMYVSGGALEHPKQYDLIWQGEKIVIFIKVSVEREPLEDDSRHMRCLYNMIGIRAPKRFMKQQEELLKLIKKAITVNHYTDIIQGITYENNDSITITGLKTPNYYEEVR